ncbi:MAG TPA: hydrogenase nickel incorporation protein HypA [Clostridiales bacterium]|nr:hydrogenase nickel incorporation protein HypA [Clostridiales bacterium]
MHELGVVFHVIKSVNRIAAENGVAHVRAVTVELGEVSAVLPDYLLDCWRWAVSKETVMKDAELILEKIPAVTLCEACGKTYPTVEHGKICPHCGSDRTVLLRGNEFILKNIVADDGDDTEPSQDE